MDLFDFVKALLKAPPRHPPEPAVAPAYVPPASTDAQVLAALDTLATTPDAAAYGAAWETIHFTLPDFDWPRHLTPAHLDGAMRQLAWMLPQSGFAGLEAFGPLRQALLAVQGHCPTAPVAPVLALHDSVFGPDVTFKTLETGATLSIEFQLHFAYWQLCALLREEPDFAEAAALVAYEKRLGAADVLLTHFHEGFGWEAPNVLERACPHLVGHYAQRLATFPAPVQCLLIYPLRRPTNPAVQALLRGLAATSPHPDVCAYARQALGE